LGIGVTLLSGLEHTCLVPPPEDGLNANLLYGVRNVDEELRDYEALGQ
jgi:hypothetical protein